MELFSLVRACKCRKPRGGAFRSPEDERQFIASYRSIAETQHSVRLYPVSDSQIVEIRQRVAVAFRKGARVRKEVLSEQSADFIASKFLLLYEMLGEHAMNEYLKYEVRYYARHGLRAEYHKEPQLP